MDFGVMYPNLISAGKDSPAFVGMVKALGPSSKYATSLGGLQQPSKKYMDAVERISGFTP